MVSVPSGVTVTGFVPRFLIVSGCVASPAARWLMVVAPPLESTVPEAPRYGGKRHASVRAALADGPKYFEELMAATGSDDGREIVIALQALREEGMIEQDFNDGRYRPLTRTSS